jgi:hypothetical protein
VETRREDEENEKNGEHMANVGAQLLRWFPVDMSSVVGSGPTSLGAFQQLTGRPLVSGNQRRKKLKSGEETWPSLGLQ